jgi:phenylpropionate dioxygenase-like ring-hydroxylating dioxygenase large terminal subunit
MDTMEETLRQRAFAAGFDPAYWYPVEYDQAVKPGQVIEVKSAFGSLALFRGHDGRLGAVENRCAHRQVKLSAGKVEDCRLTCPYHGWSYETDGRLSAIQHELFGKKHPSVRLRSYPIQVRYGLIWIFFGDPRLAEKRPLPSIPEIEGSDPWVSVPLDFLVRAHPTAIVNNVMDSTHVAALHRTFRTRTLLIGKLTRCEAQGDRVLLSHEVRLDPGGLLQFLLNPLKHSMQDSCYEYPYLWVSVGGVYKLWNFMLPIDERTTRLFLLSCADRVKIPFTSHAAPTRLVQPALAIAKRFLVTPLFSEDVWSFEAEQEGHDSNPRAPSVDLHPAIRPSYQLTVRKWEEHLASRPIEPGSLATLRVPRSKPSPSPDCRPI